LRLALGEVEALREVVEAGLGGAGAAIHPRRPRGAEENGDDEGAREDFGEGGSPHGAEHRRRCRGAGRREAGYGTMTGQSVIAMGRPMPA
jgi:hypothetical protein